MKPTNPMQQLEQWKKNHAQAKNQQTAKGTKQTPHISQETVQNAKMTQDKEKGMVTMQSDAKTHKRAKQGGFGAFPQTSRSFLLIKESITRCKSDFPDFFHHKLQHANEYQQLSNALNQGLMILQNFANKQPLDPKNKEQLRAFRQAVKYLTWNFNDVQQHVKAVQDGKDE